MDTKPLKFIILGALIGLAPTAYWYGSGRWRLDHAGSASPSAGDGQKVLYYRNPMAPTETSPLPKKAPDGMDYVPVYAEEEAAPGTPGEPGRILFYRNPMGLPDTSPVPKKDPMGMDYLPVREGEAAADGKSVTISAAKLQKLGVRTEAVSTRPLTRTIRAVGTIQVDESRQYVVAPKFEGWIEKLYVNKTGQAVARGEPLMDVYSPDLITAQQEYLIAAQGLASVAGGSAGQSTLDDVVASSLQRLRNWNVADSEIRRLQAERKPRQYLPVRSPVGGVVLDKPSIAGKRFMAGEPLFQIADLSTVWLLADVFEQDLAVVKVGQPVKIAINAYPGTPFDGKLTFVYPTLTPETRTVKVRAELANPHGLLKPAMYGSIELSSPVTEGAVTVVPDSAVLDTGIRQLVLVRVADGVFEPRQVKLGAHADGYAEVRDGVAVGENVVISANFLIDAESNLKAALNGFDAGATESSAPSPAPVKGEKAPASGAVESKPAASGTGRVEAIDREHGRITLAHDPIAVLKWPAMTMTFTVKDAGVIDGLAVGERIGFDLAAADDGGFVIVRAMPAGPQAHDAHQHAGH